VPQRSTSTISQPAAAADDATPTQTRPHEQYHYLDTIQLGHIQRGPVADHYETLTPRTQEEQGRHEFTSRPQQNKTHYVNLT